MESGSINVKFSFLCEPKENLKSLSHFAFMDMASKHSESHGGSSDSEQTASLSKMKLIDLCVYCLEGKITVFVS